MSILLHQDAAYDAASALDAALIARGGITSYNASIKPEGAIMVGDIRDWVCITGILNTGLYGQSTIEICYGDYCIHNHIWISKRQYVQR